MCGNFLPIPNNTYLSPKDPVADSCTVTAKLCTSSVVPSPWRNTGLLVFLPIMASATKENSNALVVDRVETVHLLQKHQWILKI